MRAIEKQLLVIRVNDSYGFDKYLILSIQALIKNLKHLFVEFLNPGTFLIYFKDSLNQDLLDNFIENLKEIFISNSVKLEKTTISKTVDTFTYEIDWKGKIKSHPFGGNSIYDLESIVWEISHE